MAKLVFKANGSKALAKVKALQQAAADLTPVYRTIGRVLTNRIRLCFKLGVDPWGTKWAPLKIRKGDPLRDTGLLNRSITSAADAQGVTIGTNQTPRAPVHQFGATIEPVKAKRLVFPGPNGALIFAKKVVIPARPFLPLRRNSQIVTLPPAWSADVVRALRLYFKAAGEKVA